MGRDKKELFNIIGGILTKENKGKKHFKDIKPDSELSIVVSFDSGVKIINGELIEAQGEKPILAFFLLKLIERLRSVGSVPALEVDKYLSFLKENP